MHRPAPPSASGPRPHAKGARISNCPPASPDASLLPLPSTAASQDATHCPVDLLPPELLVFIFEFAPIPARLRAIGLVCKHWRRAALRSITSLSLAHVKYPDAGAKLCALLPSLTELCVRIPTPARLVLPATLRSLRLRGAYVTSDADSVDCPLLQSHLPNLTALSLERLATPACMDALKAFLRDHWPQLAALSVSPNWHRAGVMTELDVPCSPRLRAIQLWHELELAPDWPTRLRCVWQDAPVYPDSDMSDLPNSSLNRLRDRLPQMPGQLAELAMVRSVRADSPDPPPDAMQLCDLFPHLEKVVVMPGVTPLAYLACESVRRVTMCRSFLCEPPQQALDLVPIILSEVSNLEELTIRCNLSNRPGGDTERHVRRLCALVKEAKALGVRKIKLTLWDDVAGLSELRDPHGWARVLVNTDVHF